MRKYGVAADWTAESLALHAQAVIQRAFILAKAKGSADVAAESLGHLSRYLELLFTARRKRRSAARKNIEGALMRLGKENREMQHQIVSRSAWIEARVSLLEREKELTKLRDQLAAERRSLPWVRVEKDSVHK